MSIASGKSVLGTVTENEKGEYYIIFSSGSPAALCSGVGALLGCWLAGITNFRLLGGVSAGAFIALLSSMGLNAIQILHFILDVDFSDKLSPRNDLLRLSKWLGRSRKADGNSDDDDRVPREWRSTGLLSTYGIESSIDACATAHNINPLKWPKSFWTMATTKEGSPVLFKEDGVFLIENDRKIRRLSDETIAPSQAVRMSCTIPLVMAAFRYKGTFLFDGALSRDGVCPVGIQIRHFGTDPRKIIACFLGDDSNDLLAGRVHSLCRGAWGVDPQRHWGQETAGVISFRPQIDHLHPLSFDLTRDDKWLAILISFESCVWRLAFEGILIGESLEKAQNLMRDLAVWRSPRSPGEPRLSDRAQRCFTEYGLY